MALGTDGKGLGYAPIRKSVAVKFDLYNDVGEGRNSTGVYSGGAVPDTPWIDLTGSGIDLHSGNVIHARIFYQGTTLNLTLIDTITLATWSHAFTIDIPKAVGGNTAYVGFTGATGDLTAAQRIIRWSFE